jgi:polyphosphate kinase
MNGGDEEFFCASADWMERNLLKRNETCFPVTQKSLRKQLRRDLDLYLADNTHAWILNADGSYERISPQGAEAVSAQDRFLELLAISS